MRVCGCGCGSWFNNHPPVREKESLCVCVYMYNCEDQDKEALDKHTRNSCSPLTERDGMCVSWSVGMYVCMMVRRSETDKYDERRWCKQMMPSIINAEIAMLHWDRKRERKREREKERKSVCIYVWRYVYIYEHKKLPSPSFNENACGVWWMYMRECLTLCVNAKVYVCGEKYCDRYFVVCVCAGVRNMCIFSTTRECVWKIGGKESRKGKEGARKKKRATGMEPVPR